MKRKIVYGVGIVAFIIAVTYHECYKTNKTDRYFNELNLELKGEVLAVDIPDSFNGFAIVKVKVLETSRAIYDPRNTAESYYCIIKDGVAEIYQNGVYKCEPGDTVSLDTWTRLFTINKKDGTHDVQSISLYNNEFFYKYIKKHHQKL